MIGSLIAFYFQKNRIIEKPINNFYSLIGLLLIIFSIIFFSENIQYPSIFTLPPAIGTALIIIFSTKNTHLNKIPEYFIRKQTLVNAERFFTTELKEYEIKIQSLIINILLNSK